MVCIFIFHCVTVQAKNKLKRSSRTLTFSIENFLTQYDSMMLDFLYKMKKLNGLLSKQVIEMNGC